MSKSHVPYSSILIGMWLRVGLRTDTKKEIGLRAQNMCTSLSSNSHHNWGGGMYDHLMSTSISFLISNKIYI